MWLASVLASARLRQPADERPSAYLLFSPGISLPYSHNISHLLASICVKRLSRCDQHAHGYVLLGPIVARAWLANDHRFIEAFDRKFGLRVDFVDLWKRVSYPHGHGVDSRIVLVCPVCVFYLLLRRPLRVRDARLCERLSEGV